jgi:hypothetical protein
MRIDDPGEPQSFLVQTWAKDGGEWRIVSFDMKRRNLSPPGNLFATVESAPPPKSEAAGVLDAAERLFDAWFIRRQPAEAAGFFLPQAVNCSSTSGTGPHSHSTLAVISEVLAAAVPDSRIEGVIAAPPAGHPELKPIPHPRAGAFLLAELKGDLLRSTACGAPLTATQTKSVGYATIFRLVQPLGQDPAAIILLWVITPDGLRVASYSIVSD